MISLQQSINELPSNLNDSLHIIHCGPFKINNNKFNIIKDETVIKNLLANETSKFIGYRQNHITIDGIKNCLN